LAPKAGVTLTRQDPKLVSERNKLLDILDISTRYFNQVLMQSPAAKGAREYLKKRGLSEQTITEWQIGYSPDTWDSITKLLKSKGFTDGDIFKSGMSSKKEQGQSYYDRFRGRIMFPVFDVNGNAVAFSARVSPEKEATEVMGKYINSPQTPIYDKSRILFGLDKAKQEIKRKDLAIIVEGQMDVVSAHQAGFKNVVASSGTALTKDQIALIKRYTPNVAMAFDMDDAGIMAADRGIREAMSGEMNVKVITTPSGKDPDECIRNNPAEWAQAVNDAKLMMQYYFDRIFEKIDITNIEHKRKAVTYLLALIANINDTIEQDHWLKELGKKIDVSDQLLRQALEKSRKKQTTTYVKPVEERVEPVKEKPSLSRDDFMTDLLLALILKFPYLLEYAINRIQTDQLSGLDNRAIYKYLSFYYNNLTDGSHVDNGNFTGFEFGKFRNWLENELKGGFQVKSEIKTKEQPSQLQKLDKLVFLIDEEYGEMEGEKAKNEMIKAILFLKKNHILNRLKELEKQISQAEQELRVDDSRLLLEEFKTLSDELRNL